MGKVLDQAKKRREFLLYLMSGAVPILDIGAVALGLDIKYIWLPSLVLFVWPGYLLTEKFPSTP
ncbi:MAG: hypothetical protein ABSF63_14445 [Candidatus Bathyarchaeia archaeon]|jgi:hypothetical protein